LKRKHASHDGATAVMSDGRGEHVDRGRVTHAPTVSVEMSMLGRTGMPVSRLCIGGMQATGLVSSDDARFVSTVRHGLAMGLNFIDTAPAYGDGHSESLISKAIDGYRHQVVIATKFGFHESRPAEIRESLERSLRRLRTDYIDLLQQHWPSPNVRLDDTIGELERLKTEGKIRAIGVSNWMEPEWSELDDPSRVDSLQACHSLLWRSVESWVLPLCREHGIAVLPYSPLCQGALAGRFRSPTDLPAAASDPRRTNRRLQADSLPGVQNVVRVLADVAAKYEKTVAQTALRWLLDQPGITSVVVGSSSVQQMDENVGALDWRLEPIDWQRLAEVTLPLSAELGPLDTLCGWHPKAQQTSFSGRH
jgi:myo-inositol catabolism protein IolS